MLIDLGIYLMFIFHVTGIVCIVKALYRIYTGRVLIEFKRADITTAANISIEEFERRVNETRKILEDKNDE